MWSERDVTVSRNDTIGGETIIFTPDIKSSYKSFKQISRCNCPAPETICSPVSSREHKTIGSDQDNLFKPSTNLGRSELSLHYTATQSTGETLNFKPFKGKHSPYASISTKVAVFAMH